jgi:outer membrane protein TolC
MTPRTLHRGAPMLGVFLALWCSAAHSLSQESSLPTSANTNASYLIDLPTVLRLARAQNLDIQMAREKLAEARAINQGATLQFFPWLSAGIAYSRHDGQIQNTEGDILTVSKQSYAPGGALVGQWDLGDAIYQKLAAKQLENAAGHAFDAQRQDTVAVAARDYFDLSFAQGAAGVSQEAVRISTNYEAQLQAAVEAGLALKGDRLRATVQAERNRLALRQATEQQRTAASRLAQTLHLDPSIELVARDVEPAPISLVQPNVTLPTLLRQALLARPELKQGQALAEAARATRNGTVYGPLIPSVGAEAFAGGLGGGRNGDTGNFGPQEDYFLGIGWRIGPGGLFDFGRQRAAKARLGSARIATEKTRDEISRQVVDAFTRLQSQADQINTARRGLAAAAEGLRLAQQRQEFAVGVVLENILAEQDLTRARNDYLMAIAEFNKSQYALLRATGLTSAETGK